VLGGRRALMEVDKEDILKSNKLIRNQLKEIEFKEN